MQTAHATCSRFAQYRRVTDRQTDGRTEGQTDGIAIASTALAVRALRRTVKNKEILNNFQLKCLRCRGSLHRACSFFSSCP